MHDVGGRIELGRGVPKRGSLPGSLSRLGLRHGPVAKYLQGFKGRRLLSLLGVADDGCSGVTNTIPNTSE